MNDFYTFIVVSSINSPHSAFTPADRFSQTLETFFSIRKRVPNSKIVFIDNSINPINEEQKNLISTAVDLYVDYKNNLFTKRVNKTGINKGLNELFQMEAALEEIKKANLVGKRIFKISGRYKLKDTFNIAEYEKPDYINKYVFKVVTWIYNFGNGEEYRDFFCTVLWSMCGTLIDEYLELLSQIFDYMTKTGENIEIAHNHNIPRDKLILLNSVGADGFITNGEFTQI